MASKPFRVKNVKKISIPILGKPAKTNGTNQSTKSQSTYQKLVKLKRRAPLQPTKQKFNLKLKFTKWTAIAKVTARQKMTMMMRMVRMRNDLSENKKSYLR